MDGFIENTSDVPNVQESQLEFVDYWAEQSVEHEIARGHQLREAKSRSLPKRNYVVVNFIKPPPSTKNRSRRRGSPTPCSSESRSKKNKKQKKKSPCGIRIAELAVPTKRQCLEAWRTNYNILPPQMVERLHQHVLDQRPIIQVADAMYCFKLKKSTKKRKCERALDKVYGRSKMQKGLQVNEIKTFSAVFGLQIAKKLIQPLEIKLNTDLEKIANVVSLDILDILHKSKNIDMRKKINKDILEDVTKKVTIWIADVLEETSDKILEDQYREVEEELGPVFDLIDELTNNVLDICAPETVIEDSFVESVDFQLDYMDEDSVVDSENKIFDADEEQDIGIHLQNELSTYLDNIFKEKDDMKSDDINVEVDDIIEEKEELKSEPDIYEDVENDADSQQSELGDANDDFGDALETNDEIVVVGEHNDDIANEQTNPEEESNRKVKFNADKEIAALAGDEQAEPAHIDFSSPNEDLLSDADESWPDDITPPLIRPSASASKSITSLGRITEVEERAVPSEEDIKDPGGAEMSDDKVDEVANIGTEQNSTDDDFAENQHVVPKNEVMLQGEKALEDTKLSKAEILLPKVTEVEVKLEVKDTLEREREREPDGDKETVSVGKPSQDTKKGANPKVIRLPKEKRIPSEEKGKDSFGPKDKPIAQAVRKSTTTESKRTKSLEQKERKKPEKVVYKAIKTIPKISKPLDKRRDRVVISTDKKYFSEKTSQSVNDLSEREGKESARDMKFSSLRVKTKPSYRVNANTAPAWVTRLHGEPSCLCIDATLKSKPSLNVNYHRDIRKWARDLENGYEHLKLWNEWINTTSRTINILQREIGLAIPQKCTKQSVSKLTELKINIDNDASLWRKLKRSTQERLRGYRKIYQIQRGRDCDQTLPY